MPFQFQWLCELLEELYHNLHKRTLTTARVQNYEHQIIYNWYQRFSHKIERTGPPAIAFLSCLLPEQRSDRVYNLQAKRLSQIFGRALGLGTSRASDLNQWRHRDGTDFATCVEHTLQQCENDTPVPGKEVTLEEIDEVLELIAAHAPSSSPAIRAKLTGTTPTELLTPILRRLKSTEAKWFTRLLLKNYAPVQVPQFQALHGFHFMLPSLLAIQNSFDAAVAILAKEAIRQLPARPNKNYEFALRPLVAEHVQPRIGVMIRRQPYHKARSIKNCCNLANGAQMSIERKYDGEYCQIHVDMSKGHDCVQIFSKSGRDSTSDRIRLHSAIKDALRIDRNGCAIRRQCIIEGELLVWSSSKRQIQPFYKIRKYVKHGGREIGTAQDSPARPDENLMIAFYDLLVLDDHMLINKPHKLRRQHLKAVLQTIEGRAILGERHIIDFRASRADTRLRDLFAKAITQRWEGLVLKALQEPYFSWNNQNHGIKLKKDYIGKLGDIADLCIVGGRRDPQAELQIGLGRLEWTMFYVGAVMNMEAIRRFDTKPRIKIIDIMTHHSMPNAELLDLNRLGRLVQADYDPDIAEFSIETGRFSIGNPSVLFKKPFIVEIMGAGFEKSSDTSFFTLRFPRKVDGKVKLHTDRNLLDTVSFTELQNMAERSMTVPADQDSQEDAQWIERLIEADGRNRVPHSISQNTNSAITPISPSTISLSPISPGTKGTTRMFVRPDTEEPDSQHTGVHTANLLTAIDPDNKWTESAPSSTPIKSQSRTGKSKKRRCETLQMMSNKQPRTERPRMEDAKLMISGDTTLESDEVVDLKSSLAMSRPTAPQSAKCSTELRPAQLRESAFDPPAVFYTPRTVITTCEIVEKVPTDAMETPDSPMVMRQVMAMCNRPGFHVSHVNPTKILNLPTTGKHSSHPPTRTLPPFLPTPPTSSPAVDKKANEPSDLPKQIVPTVVETRKHLLPASNQKQLTSTPPPSSVTGMAAVTGVDPPLEQDRPLPNLSPILIFNANPDFTASLSSIEMDFTFSTTRFLTRIDTANTDVNQARKAYHIILLDLSIPEAAADAFEAMAHNLQSHLSQVHNPASHEPNSMLEKYNNQILVFDHSILKHENIVDGKLKFPVLQDLDFGNGRGRDAALFCGVARFYRRKNVVAGGEAELRIGIQLEYRFEWTQRN